jgi:hypothetical protein
MRGYKDGYRKSMARVPVTKLKLTTNASFVRRDLAKHLDRGSGFSKIKIGTVPAHPVSPCRRGEET